MLSWFASGEAKSYLTLLHSELKGREGGEGARLGQGLVMEYGESRSVLTGLVQLLDEMGEWEPETSLPTRLHDVRKSVEMESDGGDAETSDAEADDLSDDDNTA